MGKEPSRRPKLERRGSLVPSTQDTTWSTARKVRVGVTMLFTVTKARIDLTLSPFMPPKDTCVIISKNIWKRFTMLRPREKGARQVKVAPIGLRKMVMVDGGEEEKATLANTPSKLITITGLIASPLKILKKKLY